MSPESEVVHLIQDAAGGSPSRCWSVAAGSPRAALFTFAWPPYAGSMAVSGDGRVIVWREALATRVWRSAEE